MNLTLSSSPEEQHNAFLSLKTPREVASLLEIKYGLLIYHIYKVPDEKKYNIFHIPKKNGGVREIASPATSLKIIQRKLNEVFSNVYKPKPSVFGYTQGKNIVNNALKHKKAKYVLNIDLKDFFPSINFGRVRGLLIGKPYNLPPKVATIIAQICCYKNYLPQGAPTSPVISNMICGQMDSQLQALAMKYKCYYSRYADDITFSTSLKEFPEAIAKVLSPTEVEIGKEISSIIGNNGFQINPQKVRLSPYYRRQEVTGLTVNLFPNVRRSYVREIRAMLHAWDKYGLLNAEKEFFQKYDDKHRNPELRSPSYRQIVKGKIEFLGMVRGKKDTIYYRHKKYYNKLIRRDKGIPSLSAFDLEGFERPHVYTEGLTDAIILNVSWQKLFPGVPIPFVIVDSNPIRKSAPGESGGGAHSLKEFLNNVREDHPHIVIGIFDRDGEGEKEYGQLKNDYIEKGDIKISKNRKSAAFKLPIPGGKELFASYENLCIEYYFSEGALNTKTSEGYGLTFEYPQIIQTIESVKYKEKIQNTIPETRKIREGKRVFAEKIVPTLLNTEFDSFKIVFKNIFELIEILEIKNPAEIGIETQTL